MADFATTYGPPIDQGGFMFSHIKSLYKAPDMKSVIDISGHCRGLINHLLDTSNRSSPSVMTRPEQLETCLAWILVFWPSKMQIVSTRTWYISMEPPRSRCSVYRWFLLSEMITRSFVNFLLMPINPLEEYCLPWSRSDWWPLLVWPSTCLMFQQITPGLIWMSCTFRWRTMPLIFLRLYSRLNLVCYFFSLISISIDYFQRSSGSATSRFYLKSYFQARPLRACQSCRIEEDFSFCWDPSAFLAPSRHQWDFIQYYSLRLLMLLNSTYLRWSQKAIEDSWGSPKRPWCPQAVYGENPWTFACSGGIHCFFISPCFWQPQGPTDFPPQCCVRGFVVWRTLWEQVQRCGESWTRWWRRRGISERTVGRWWSHGRWWRGRSSERGRGGGWNERGALACTFFHHSKTCSHQLLVKTFLVPCFLHMFILFFTSTLPCLFDDSTSFEQPHVGRRQYLGAGQFIFYPPWFLSHLYMFVFNKSILWQKYEGFKIESACGVMLHQYSSFVSPSSSCSALSSSLR